ncbi:DNA-binding transcriptional regulator [Limisphaera ngatamarikiensis]|uniref:DNA-binding transcriptional regulator n=1 Tax=Limisphaera ngatamarikiensis TaxID=1324935 RepID=A0A6M1RU01_9BACT|nr:DNA-binding transcriptional regulator [Limisphaera ngatamarikiensis]NGO38242.1 DNA-binding transcriptional regulator [Limisphaera ngatamarikiensis]
MKRKAEPPSPMNRTIPRHVQSAAPGPVGNAPRRVLLLVETSLASGRDILRGIARYVRERGQWVLFHEPRGLEVRPPHWLSEWRGDGVIARIQSPALAEAVRAMGVPAVDVLGLVPEAGIPLVHVDDRAIARMAADHLRQRGFQHFGFYGLNSENWSLRRRDAFCQYVAEWGGTVSVYERPRLEGNGARWAELEQELLQWLRNLPKPAGVMVSSDQLGLGFLEACRQAGVAVPEEIAVVGVDNDDALCEIAHPPLSSIWPAHQRVGYEAAALLDRLMRGEPPPRQPVLIPPLTVVTRRSTDVLAVADRQLARALQIIREQACRGLGVADVARAAGLSRSVLQRRFRALLGRTVHQTILEVRIQRACQLLRETDMPIAQVAEEAGFRHQEYLGAVLKRRLGKTPAQIRREAESRPAHPAHPTSGAVTMPC